MALTTSNLCELFQVHKATLTRWRRDGLSVAFLGRDQWNGPLALEWWIANIRWRKMPTAGVVDLDGCLDGIEFPDLTNVDFGF